MTFFVQSAELIDGEGKNLFFAEWKAIWIVILYVQFTTLTFTFHRGLDLQNCLFLSGLPTEILCVFVISLVHFSCPICPTDYQFTTHQHLLINTIHAAPQCAVLFIPLLLPLSSDQISPSVPVPTQYFRVNPVEHQHKHTPLDTLNSV